MKNNWVKYYSGVITVKISGKGIERFLNQLTRSELHIWQVKRHGTEMITFKIKLTDIKKLRILARHCPCKISFIKREGFPFFMKKVLKNSGVVTGVFLFVLTMFLLSNMIWKINISGASPETEENIRKQLTALGVKVGTLQFFVDDVEMIQRKLTDQIEAITWIGVELNGTVYQFKVVEKESPEEQQVIGPQNLIAKQKAMIVDMFVEEGKTEVKVHDYVQRGQLLVSGIIGKEGEEKLVPAKGKIFGETWYKSEVKLPIEMSTLGLTGNKKKKHVLKVDKLSIPIWGFGKVNYTDYKLEENEHHVYLLQWKLPISYVKKTYREQEKVTRIYSNEEAIQTAKELARKDLEDLLDDDANIKGEKVLHQVIDNGKVFLTIHFQVIENIAVGQPLIQGD